MNGFPKYMFGICLRVSQLRKKDSFIVKLEADITFESSPEKAALTFDLRDPLQSTGSEGGEWV